MSNYSPYVTAMEDAGFFKPHALPLMLEKSFDLVK
jgi:hypothetical protein